MHFLVDWNWKKGWARATFLCTFKIKENFSKYSLPKIKKFGYFKIEGIQFAGGQSNNFLFCQSRVAFQDYFFAPHILLLPANSGSVKKNPHTEHEISREILVRIFSPPWSYLSRPMRHSYQTSSFSFGAETDKKEARSWSVEGEAVVEWLLVCAPLDAAFCVHARKLIPLVRSRSSLMDPFGYWRRRRSSFIFINGASRIIIIKLRRKVLPFSFHLDSWQGKSCDGTKKSIFIYLYLFVRV